MKSAAPDGYTLMWTISTTMIMNKVLFKKLPYDPDKDFALVSWMNAGHLPTIINKDVPARNMARVRRAGARPPSLVSGRTARALPSHVAAAGAGKRPEALGLTATPTRWCSTAAEPPGVRLRNSGRKAGAQVEVASAGFALDLRGRPRIVKRRGPRSAAGWLSLRPARIRLAPHAAGTLLVSARLPRRAEPGDHDALVLLSARPLARARLSVRLRLGVVVVVRAPGAVVWRVNFAGCAWRGEEASGRSSWSWSTPGT